MVHRWEPSLSRQLIPSWHSVIANDTHTRWLSVLSVGGGSIKDVVDGPSGHFTTPLVSREFKLSPCKHACALDRAVIFETGESIGVRLVVEVARQYHRKRLRLFGDDGMELAGLVSPHRLKPSLCLQVRREDPEVLSYCDLFEQVAKVDLPVELALIGRVFIVAVHSFDQLVLRFVEVDAAHPLAIVIFAATCEILVGLEELRMSVYLLQANHIPVQSLARYCWVARLEELLFEERLAVFPGKVLGGHSWERVG